MSYHPLTIRISDSQNNIVNVNVNLIVVSSNNSQLTDFTEVDTINTNKLVYGQSVNVPIVPIIISNTNIDYRANLISGSLPEGLTFNTKSGFVTGTPTQNGHFEIGVSFNWRQIPPYPDPIPQYDIQAPVTLKFDVFPPLSNTATIQAIANNINQVYYVGVSSANFSPLNVDGGVKPYTYYIKSGYLPPGLSLNSSTGVISGTPTRRVVGNRVTFAVRDSLGQECLTVNELIIPVEAQPNPTAGQVYFNFFDKRIVADEFAWIVPPGVTSICVAAVGAGGSSLGFGGAGGGGLGWKNNITVVPGQKHIIRIGRPSLSVTANGYALLGTEREGTSVESQDGLRTPILTDRSIDPPNVSNTVFYSSNGTPLVVGCGGENGKGFEWDEYYISATVNESPGVGGGYVGDGGYVGGTGGTSNSGYSGGGGGSATLSGNGNDGADSGNAYFYAELPVGNGGRGADFFYSSTYGGGAILDGSTRLSFYANHGGGGGGGNSAEMANPNNTIAYGQVGGLRIMWGAGRAYPNTNIADV
jgi:hypothetical protein